MGNHSAAHAALDCCANRSFGLRKDLGNRIRDLCGKTLSDRKAVILTAVQSLRREITARRMPLWTAARIAALVCGRTWGIESVIFAERLTAIAKR